MRKQRVLNILSDMNDFCAHKRDEMFYKLEYDKDASEEDKCKAVGAYKAYLDIEDKLIRKIDRIRWNSDY